MRYRATDWSLDIPVGWIVNTQEDCATLTHPDGVGALQVSSHRRPVPLTDEDLRNFTGDLPVCPVTIDRLTGFHRRFCDQDTFWAKWWLRCGDRMLHLTYNCAVTDRGTEYEAVEAMIDSMRVESPGSPRFD
jgi:hypothetical protein